MFTKHKKEVVKTEMSEAAAVQNSNVSEDPLVVKLLTDVDRLKSSMEANSELRQVNSERFSRLDEQIGELRTMIVDREKDLGELEVKATRAADLVAEVQPEALMTEVRKSDIKVESLKGKLESYHELNNTILDELKDIRRAVKTFRGIEEVRNMLNDAHKDITTYTKIEGAVESRADKIEETYDDFLKKFEEFKNFKDQLNDINNKVTNYEEAFNKVNDLNQEILKKTEFNDFSTKIHEFVVSLEKQMHEVHVNVNFINELKDLVDSLESELATIVTELGDIKKNGSEKVNNELQDLRVKQDNIEMSNSTLKQKYDALNNRINSFELSLQGNDLSSVEERLLILETSVNKISQTMEGINEGLIVFSEGQEHVLDDMHKRTKKLDSQIEGMSVFSEGQEHMLDELQKRMDYLDKKLAEAENREIKMIDSVKNIISIIEKIKH